MYFFVVAAALKKWQNLVAFAVACCVGVVVVNVI